MEKDRNLEKIMETINHFKNGINSRNRANKGKNNTRRRKKKRTWILVIVLYTIGHVVYGQNEEKHYFGAQYLYGACKYHSGSSGKQYDGTYYFGLSFDFRFRYTEKTEISLGLTATLNKIDLNGYAWGGNGGGGGSYYFEERFGLLSLPVQFKYHFLNYFFIGGGPCLNMHMTNTNKWGFGLEINGGMEYVFKSGITISLTPRRQWNWVNPYGDEYFFGIDSNIVSQTGVNIGLGYRF